MDKKQFILERKSLFWGVAKNELENVSQECVVETILNYGNLNDFKLLFPLFCGYLNLPLSAIQTKPHLKISNNLYIFIKFEFGIIGNDGKVFGLCLSDE